MSAPGAGKPRWAERSWRRLLIDTHIPDWDEAFLSKFSVAAVLDAVERSGAQAVMAYFQSHVGLCNWPSKSGATHRALRDGDFMRDLVTALHARDIPVCAYYSVHFNNWAYLEHPEWRFEQVTQNGMGPLPAARYGLCCANNPEYRAFVCDQAREILAYDIDAFFFDMMWQPGVCGCRHCRARYMAETGAEFPQHLDWRSEEWCGFQAARERWTAEWAHTLRDLVHAYDPGLDVYHNFAMGVANWSRAVSFDAAEAHDFLGGDFYGGRDEQLVVCKLMSNLSRRRPIEFMTTVTRDLTEHETLKSQQEHDLLAFAAVAHHAAFLAIAAWDPDGAINAAGLDIIRASFERAAPYAPFLGGTPVEEVGVYFSSASKMSFADDGAILAQLRTNGSTDYPHFHAVRGACAALQQAHLPFGVITRKQLGALNAYRAIVLPNVLRMDEEECAALRAYVAGGGRLYASRLTSLAGTQGARGDDFALADVFGVSFAGEETGASIYIEPGADWVARAVAPQRRIAHAIGARSGAVRLRAGAGAPLAALTLPYGYPHRGAVGDRNWSSIHSSPPNERVAAPTLVRNRYGEGEAIYCAADIETGDGASRALFVASVRALLADAPPRFEAQAPACVWVTAFEQETRLVVSLLNYQAEPPVLPVENLHLTLRPPPGKRIARVLSAPDGAALSFTLAADGAARLTSPTLGMFAMIIAEYEP